MHNILIDYSNKAVKLMIHYQTHIQSYSVHMHIIFPTDVTGVSPSEGSVNGGTMITIYGNYFDPNAESVEVLVGGKL